MKTRPTGFLGIRTANGSVVEVLDIARRSTSSAIFTTIADAQRRARFDFYFRRSPTEEWLYLDSLPVERIPPAPAGEPDLAVRVCSRGAAGLVLGIEGPAMSNTRTFGLDLHALMPSRRRAQPGSAAQPTAVSPVLRGPRHPAHLFFPIAAALLAAAAVLALVVFGPAFPERAPARGGALPADATARESAAGTGLLPTPAPQGTVQGQGAAEVAAASPGAAAAAAPSPVTPAQMAAPSTRAVDPGQPLRHRIRWGETLWRIAEQYYGNRELFAELARRNGLADPDAIVAGDSLELPPTLGNSSIVAQEGNDADGRELMNCALPPGGVTPARRAGP